MHRRALVAVGILVLYVSAATAEGQARLFYVTTGAEKQVSLWGADASASQPSRLATVAAAGAMAWSPNGRYLTFVQPRAQGGSSLLLVDGSTGTELAVSSPDQPVLSCWWSDRSDRLLYLVGAREDKGYALYAHDLKTGSRPTLVSGALKAAGGGAVCSADGAYAAFSVADEAKPRQVAIAELATGKASVVSGDLQVESFQWSLSGATLALLAQGGDPKSMVLYVVEPGGSPRRVSLADQRVLGFLWRPGGTDLVYMTGVPIAVETADGRKVARTRTVVYAANALRGEPTPISGIANASGFQWSDDGRYYVVTDITDSPSGPLPSLKVGSFDGPLRVPALVRSSTGASIATWSPNGTRLAFIREGGLFAFDVATLRSQIVVSSTALTVRDMTWAPDSSHLAILAPYEQGLQFVWVVDAVQAKGHPVSNAFPTGGIDWSPDGSSILLWVQSGGEEGTLYLLSPGGKPEDARKVADKVLTTSWYPKK